MDAGMKPYQVLACDIMGEDCNESNHPAFVEAYQKENTALMSMLDPPDVSIGNIDAGLSKQQIDAIENELKMYDCGFSRIPNHRYMGIYKRITILYDTNLSANMKACDQNKVGFYHKDAMKEMWNRITQIADPLHDSI